MPGTVSFTLNGQPVSLKVDGDRKLLWVLRTELAQTGTKFSCGKGLCGACTVLVNDRPARSCMLKLSSLQNKKVMTIEGLAQGGQLHPLQKAFMEHDALQCGFCTSGMILNAYSLLVEKPRPTKAEIIETMNDNLCRCGTHLRIVRAIQSAAEEMKGGRRG